GARNRGVPGSGYVDLQSIEARDALITKGKVGIIMIKIAEAILTRFSVWPASHQSDHFRAGNGWANRVRTRIIVSGVHLVVTAWFNDIHTMFVQFEPDFPSGAFTHLMKSEFEEPELTSSKAPNFLMAGLEDLATGFLRQPWRIAWDSIYSLTTRGGETLQFDNQFVMWWK
ncbi:hypothetical protein CTAM01_17065, partial [Colletotrichum tamarilloi]